MRTYSIYAFVDINEVPFYIGKTYNMKKRTKEHFYEVRRGNKLPKYNKLRKLAKEGCALEKFIKIIEENIPLDKADEREIFWIAKLRENGYKLKNLTDGGEGAINSIPGLSKKLRKLRLGKKLSEETKKKISQSNLGKKFTDAHKKKLSIARKKRIITSETRIKASNTSKGIINIKQYKLMDPNGKEYITKNGLTAFCEEHDLCRPNILKVISGKRKHHKGWVAQKT